MLVQFENFNYKSFNHESALVDVTFRIRRLEDEHKRGQISTEEFNEIKRSEHQERAKLIHAVAAALGLEVKDWSQIDTQKIEEMREEVDVNLGINAGEILTAAVFAFKIWLDRKKLQRVYVAEDKRGGRVISLEGVTINQVDSFINKLGLNKTGPRKKSGKK